MEPRATFSKVKIKSLMNIIINNLRLIAADARGLLKEKGSTKKDTYVVCSVVISLVANVYLPLQKFSEKLQIKSHSI